MTTKYYTRRPFKVGKTYYKGNQEVSGFTSIWRYYQLLRYGHVVAMDTPAAPTGLSVVNGDTEAFVTFTAPAVVNTPILYYQASINNGSTWLDFDPPATSSPAHITGLTNGQTYQVKLRAVNRVGNGAASSAVTAAPEAP